MYKRECGIATRNIPYFVENDGTAMLYHPLPIFSVSERFQKHRFPERMKRKHEETADPPKVHHRQLLVRAHICVLNLDMLTNRIGLVIGRWIITPCPPQNEFGYNPVRDIGDDVSPIVSAFSFRHQKSSFFQYGKQQH